MMPRINKFGASCFEAMRASDKMMNELLLERERKCRSRRQGLFCVARRIIGGRRVSRCHRASDTVGKKCCAPHYSSGLIPAEIIYVRALLPRITPRFALALKFMSVSKTVRPVFATLWVKDGREFSVLQWQWNTHTWQRVCISMFILTFCHQMRERERIFRKKISKSAFISSAKIEL